MEKNSPSVLGRCEMNNNNIIITSAQEYCYAGINMLVCASMQLIIDAALLK